MKKEIKMPEIVSHCKTYGFMFPSSEIYDGVANVWDYGPFGVELKNNIKQFWWKKFVLEGKNTFGIDAAIFMNPKVWEASGHIASFSDPMIDCKECRARHRVDKLIAEFSKNAVNADKMTNHEMQKYITESGVKCPVCGKRNFTPLRNFNLMFSTNRGVVEGNSSLLYLRPETAQGQYVNFLNVQRSVRAKIPFGIGQIGKAFRNEITPGNFTFRTIEFEQMEFQWFCKPGEDIKYYEEYKEKSKVFYKELGIPDEKLQYHNHDKLAHYAKAACDVYFKFPWGFDEVNGIHNRTDFDLKNHQNLSGKKMEYIDPATNERYIPYIIENSYGADRVTLAVICNSLEFEELNDGDIREIMHISPKIAPIKAAILPLNKKEQGKKAEELFEMLCKEFRCIYDDTGSIGKRYRRQDAIGTPFCITVDFDTENDESVTVRERDSMTQERIKIKDLTKYINKHLN